MSKILEAVNLSKTYGKGEAAVRAVQDASLAITKGELALVMGPSGSGKTTLLLMCGALLRPDSGKVTLDGLDLTAMNERQLPEVRLKKIGFVFQHFNLLGGFTALENVEVVLSINGVAGDEARSISRKALERVGMSGRADHLPEDLSGGEKQRVAVARALVNNPKLIIADEPTGNLDSKTGEAIIELVRNLVKTERRAALVASHDHRIQGLADIVVRLEDGRLVA